MSLICPHCEATTPVRDLCSECSGTLVIAGQYQLISLRGRGGGLVYEGKRLSDGLPVAVKIIPLSATDWGSGDAFERASKLLRGLDHPALPKVYHFSQDAYGRIYFVRELLADDTLEERVKGGRHVDLPSFERLFRELLEGIQYLHSLVPPLIHRDIRPSNIMFRSEESWSPVIVDFDSVASLSQAGADAFLTSPGSSAYAAPEQREGEVSPSLDLYSAALSLAFVSTHLEPEDLTDENGNIVLEGRLIGVGENIRSTLEGALKRAPRARFQSAAEMLASFAPPEVVDRSARHISASEMTIAEIEARIDGWLAVEGEKRAQVLVPYLARLNDVGYDFYRQKVAEQGQIRVEVLDDAVQTERHKLAPAVVYRRQPGNRQQVPMQQRPMNGRGSQRTAGCLIPIIVLAVGAAIFAVTAAQFIMSKLPGALTSYSESACNVEWLTKHSDAVESCVWWGDNEEVMLGCTHQDPQAETFCQTVKAIPTATPSTLDLGGVLAMLEIAKQMGFDSIPTESVLLSRAKLTTNPFTSIPFGDGSSKGGSVQTPKSEELPEEVALPEEVRPPTGNQTPLNEVLTHKKVDVTFETKPPGALLTIEGQSCRSPCVVTIPEGRKVMVSVELPGYQTQTRPIFALSNKTVSIDLEKD